MAKKRGEVSGPLLFDLMPDELTCTACKVRKPIAQFPRFFKWPRCYHCHDCLKANRKVHHAKAKADGRERAYRLCNKIGRRNDETLDKKDVRGFITFGGAGRRKYYSLNNTGMEYAASQAKQIFQ